MLNKKWAILLIKVLAVIIALPITGIGLLLGFGYLLDEMTGINEARRYYFPLPGISKAENTAKKIQNAYKEMIKNGKASDTTTVGDI